MSLPAGFIRKGIKDSKSESTKTNSKPRGRGGFLHHDRKTFHKKLLDLFLFSWLGFEPDEQCYFDHDMSPVCALTYRTPNGNQRKPNHCLALAFHMDLPVKYGRSRTRP